MDLMENIKRQLQFVVAILLLILVPVQSCSASGDNSQSGPVIFSSSNHNLLSEDGKTTSGKIFVKNNSDYRVEKFSIKGDVSPIVVDPASSCFKPVESGGMCEFSISHTKTPDSLPRIPIRFEVVGNNKNFSDSLTINVISVKPDVFFSPVDDNTNIKSISGLTNSFATVNKNGVDFLYAGTTDGIFKTNDGGANWVAVNNGLTNKYVRVLHSSGDYLYVGTNGGGVFKTNNGGTNWVAVSNGLTNKYVRVLHSSGDYLYAGTFGDGVFKTNDGGANWVAVSNGLTDKSVQALHSSGDYLYAGTNDGVFKTNDGGANWVAVNNGLINKNVWALHSSGDYLYAGTSNCGVFKTNDGGANWVAVNNELTYTGVPALHSSGDYLYAGTFNGGVFKTNDGGANWVVVNNELTYIGVSALHSTGDYLYAGTWNGVFKTNGCRANWMAVNNELTYTGVSALHSSDDYLYVGTHGGGVFKMKLSKSLKPEPRKLSTEEQERLAKAVNDMQNACEDACKEELIRMRSVIRNEDKEKCNAKVKEIQKKVVGSNSLRNNAPRANPATSPPIFIPPPCAYETVEGMQNACENACKQELIRMRSVIRNEDREKCNAKIKEI